MSGVVCYISGPITGKPDLNRPAFAKAAEVLRARGFGVVNPFDVCADPASWEDAMRADIKALMDCNAIALLPGWRQSRGATIEARLAADLGMKHITLETA